MELSKLWTISTNHLTKVDDSRLMQGDVYPLCTIFNLTPDGSSEGYGYLLYVNQDLESDPECAKDNDGWSDALIKIQRKAFENGIEVVRLSPDGPIDPTLAYYEW